MRRLEAYEPGFVKNLALTYASRYEVSEHKLRQYLVRKFLPNPQLTEWIEQAIEYCTRINAVNDLRVSEQLQGKLMRQGKGARIVQLKMKQWGLESNYKPIDTEQETNIALEWVHKYLKKNLEDKKIIQRLMSKGFNYPIIQDALKQAKEISHVQDTD